MQEYRKSQHTNRKLNHGQKDIQSHTQRDGQTDKHTHLSESGYDGLRMDFERDKSLCFFEQFAGEDDDGSGAIPDFVILNFGNVDENFGSRIVNADGFENRRSVVCHLFGIQN